MDGNSYFDVTIRKQNLKLDRLSLPMPGKHNISNALAAIAIACHLEIDYKLIRSALSEFKGVNRRFTQVAEINGIKIIDDYGHHPVEISAVLNAARQTSNGKVFAIHQPHRYTRLNSYLKISVHVLMKLISLVLWKCILLAKIPLKGHLDLIWLKVWLGTVIETFFNRY